MGWRVLQRKSFDLTDQKRQIGRVEGETGRGNAVVFDVGRDVFVVRMGTGQFRDVGMGLGVVACIYSDR